MKMRNLFPLLVLAGLLTACPGRGDPITSGGGDNPPVPPVPPTPKTVKRSELRDVFEEIGKAVFGEDDYRATVESWDSEELCYTDVVYYAEKSQKYTWESAIDEFIELLPEGGTQVIAPRTFTWADGGKGVETAYTYNDSIYVEAGTYEEDSSIYIQFDVYPNDGYELINDCNEENRNETYKVTFLNQSTFSGDFTNDNKDRFITWFNQDTDLLKDISIKEGCYAQVNEIFSGFKTFILGSGKKDGNFKFTFNYNILNVKIGVQAYYNEYSYGTTHGFSVDTDAKLTINNETTPVDLTTTVEDKATVEQTVERTYTVEDNQTTFELSNTSPKGRVCVNWIEITYAA